MNKLWLVAVVAASAFTSTSGFAHNSGAPAGAATGAV